MMTTAMPAKILVFGAGALMSLLILFYIARSDSASSIPEVASAQIPWLAKNNRHALGMPTYNNTLGFEKIFALNLPERSDKRDGMSLAASLTNISIRYIDGVKGEDVLNKSLPYGQQSRKFTNPMLGSWRAHMNAIRTIIEEDYSSVLILEDDVDWDIRIKDQLTEFAHGVRWMQKQSDEVLSHSPYGDDWDVLWLGHCHDHVDKEMPAFIVSDDRSTVRPSNLPVGEKDKVMLAQWPDHTRIIHEVFAPICTYAYALSQRGARKVLWNLSVDRLDGLFDNAISWFCRDRRQGAKCYNAHPSYIMPHESRGGMGKNSDNRPKMKGREKSQTRGIQWPARMNIKKLLEGKTDFEDAYPDQ